MQPLLLLRSPAVVFTAAEHPLSSLPDGNSQAPTRTRTRTSSSPASPLKADFQEKKKGEEGTTEEREVVEGSHRSCRRLLSNGWTNKGMKKKYPQSVSPATSAIYRSCGTRSRPPPEARAHTRSYFGATGRPALQHPYPLPPRAARAMRHRRRRRWRIVKAENKTRSRGGGGAGDSHATAAAAAAAAEGGAESSPCPGWILTRCLFPYVLLHNLYKRSHAADTNFPAPLLAKWERSRRT